MKLKIQYQQKIWLKKFITSFEFTGEKVERIKDFWQTKTLYVNGEYITWFYHYFR